ncbi:PE-PGRS family protein [Streptomyces sp. NPDC087270]|uniref:PE-PGRS family protein n=1 Tax=Streptomyces sp. NPDC087270 TaxID=3365774 RepID=UPI003824B57E
MADFRRPPDWDQGADRHSDLSDPVLVVRQLARFEYRKLYSRIDNALVFTTGKGGYDVFMPPHRPTRSEMATKRYSAVYEVDVGIHRCASSLRLPSDNDAFHFTAELELSWQVVRPDLFVASGERHVPTLLERRFEELARPHTRALPIDRSSAAEQAVRRAVETAGPLGGDAGLRVDWMLRLHVDDDALAHQRELRQTRYADEKLSASHALAMREDRLQAERTTAQAEQEHELAMLKGRGEIERQSLEAEKIEFYQYYLQQEGVRSWAFHLAQHPEDSRLVMESLRQDQLALIQSQVNVALDVLKSAGLEEYQREDMNKHAAQIIEEVLTRNLPGATKAPPPMPGVLPWTRPHDAPPPSGPHGSSEPSGPSGPNGPETGES